MLSPYEIQHDCTQESLQEICKERGINHLVFLKSSEKDFVRVRSFCFLLLFRPIITIFGFGISDFGCKLIVSVLIRTSFELRTLGCGMGTMNSHPLEFQNPKSQRKQKLDFL